MEPFHFFTQAHLVLLSGLKAKNIVQLLDGIKKVPPASIYYHTHRFFQEYHYIFPVPPNDFGFWITKALNDTDFGETVSSIDTINFKTIEDLRNEFIRILSNYIDSGQFIRDCLDGQELQFMSCVTFVLPTNYKANNTADFIEILDKISVSSLYYHVFEAKTRLEDESDDFTKWFKSIDEGRIAEKIARLDPYSMNLENLRTKIKEIVINYAGY